MYVRKCKQIEILPMCKRFVLNDIIIFYKIINCLRIPVEMPYYLSLFNGNSRLRFCHLDRLSYVSSVLSRGKSVNFLKKSFFYRSHIFWNSLPLEIREVRSLNNFKHKVKQHLWKLALDEVADNDTDRSMSGGIT